MSDDASKRKVERFFFFLFFFSWVKKKFYLTSIVSPPIFSPYFSFLFLKKRLQFYTAISDFLIK